MNEAQKNYASDIEGHPDAPANRWHPDRPPVSGACKVCEGWGAYCDDHRPPVSGEPRTEAGRDTLDDVRYAAAPGSPYYERLRQRILAIESEASTGAALPFSVLRLAEAIDDHNLWMGGLEDHGDGVGCSTDCAGDIYARLAEEGDR